MIVRVDVELDSGTRKYQLGIEEHVTPDASYLRKLLSVSEIVKTGNSGQGWEVGSFSCVIDDADSAIRNAAEIWDGRKIIVKAMQEVDAGGGSWSLVERDRWIGAIDTPTVPVKGRIALSASENHGILGITAPSETINSTDYPAAAEASFGKPIQALAGTHILAGGAVVAWYVGDGRYLLSANECQTIVGVYASGVEIPSQYWGHQVDGGKSYILYTPPTGVEGISEEVTDSIYVNVIATESDNPVDCLKTILDEAAIGAGLSAGDLFAGDSTLAAAMTARGYKASMSTAMTDEVGDIITEFCENFDCRARIGDDNKIALAFVNPSSVATFDTEILGATDIPQPSEAVNHCKLEWGWNFPNSKFHAEDTYVHADSVDTYGRRNGELSFFFTRDSSTVLDVARRYVRQRRQVPRKLTMQLNFADQTGVDLFDVITVEFETLLYSGQHTYEVRNKRIDYLTETVTLECVTYFSSMDYYVKVTRNFGGGDVDYLGLIVLSAGASKTFTATPKTDHSLYYIWIDWTTKQTSGNSYTISSISADHEIQFVFKRDKYRIVAMDDGICTISPKGDVMVASGASQSFTVSLPSGKTFLKWVVDEGSPDTGYPYQFTNVSSDHTIKAFSTDINVNKVAVTIIKTGTGTISPPAYNGSTTVYINWGNEVWLTFDKAATVTRDGSNLGSMTGVYLGKLTANTTVEVAF